MPTKEELAKVVPPEDVRTEINKYIESSGFPREKIKNAYLQVLAQSSLDTFTDIDERCRNAWYMMAAKIKARMPNEGVLFPMEFSVFAMTGIGAVPVKREKVDPISNSKVVVTEETPMAKVYGVFTGASSTDPDAPQLPAKIGMLTLWGDAGQLLRHIRKNGAYRCRLAVKTFDDHYELSLNNFEKPPEPIENTLPAAKDIIKQFYTPILVPEIGYHIGDHQIIYGRIVRGYTKLAKNGKNIGHTVIQDAKASVGASKPGQKSEYSIMWSNAPEFATEYPAGTECYFMANVSNKNEQYGLSIYGEFILPITEVDANLESVFDDLFGDGSSETQAAPAAPVAPIANDPWAEPVSQPAPASTAVPSPASISKW